MRSRLLVLALIGLAACSSASGEDTGATADEQEAMLTTILSGVQPAVVRQALKDPSVPPAMRTAFEGVDRKERGRLYRMILWMLFILALAGLVLGGAAIQQDKDSAAFFTFAGLALGGLTGILVPTPGKSDGD